MARFNLFIVNALPNIECIEQYFLESGHSYLPNDRDFSDVSKALKKRAHIFVPSQWYDFVRNARSRNPFKVEELGRSDFKSLSELDTVMINRHKNEDKTPVKWLKIK